MIGHATLGNFVLIRNTFANFSTEGETWPYIHFDLRARGASTHALRLARAPKHTCCYCIRRDAPRPGETAVWPPLFGQAGLGRTAYGSPDAGARVCANIDSWANAPAPTIWIWSCDFVSFVNITTLRVALSTAEAPSFSPLEGRRTDLPRKPWGCRKGGDGDGDAPLEVGKSHGPGLHSLGQPCTWRILEDGQTYSSSLPGCMGR